MFDLAKHKAWLNNVFKFKPIFLPTSNDVQGISNNVFISSSSYPIVSFGPSVSNQSFDFNQLFGKPYKSIIKYFLSSIHGRISSFVYARNIEKIQEIGMSYKPINVEMYLKRKPNYTYSKLSHITVPIGPIGNLRFIKEQENPSIPKKVDSLYNEKINSIIGISELYSRGFDNYYITRLFSIGILGRRKKLVPTRWSITAIDDILSKLNIKKIRDYPFIRDIYVFDSSFLYNQFVVLMIPGIWEFENFEAWDKHTTWGAANTIITEEYEDARGRKKYAELQVGGYYASRFSITEYLTRIRRQARVIVFREIYSGYKVPVGVWQVRENVRNALSKKPMKFERLSDALSYVSTKLKFPLYMYVKKSRVLSKKTILDYF